MSSSACQSLTSIKPPRSRRWVPVSLKAFIGILGILAIASAWVCISLGGTQVTDAGLEHFHKMPTLRELWLDRTMVTNAGVVELRIALPFLWYVFNCEVKVLEANGRSAHVELTGPQVTDDTLCRICSTVVCRICPGCTLQALTLTKTNVTDAGVAELERAMPGLTVCR